MENLMKIFPKDIWSEIVKYLTKKVYLLIKPADGFSDKIILGVFSSMERLIDYLHNYIIKFLRNKSYITCDLPSDVFFQNMDDITNDKTMKWINNLSYPIPNHYGQWSKENVYRLDPGMVEFMEFNIEEYEII